MQLKQRLRIRVVGIVQGVGFRPFVARLAEDLGLAGFVRNTTSAVVIEVDGLADLIESVGNLGRSFFAEAERSGHHGAEGKYVAAADAAAFEDFGGCSRLSSDHGASSLG